MEEGTITSHELERIITAVEHEMKLNPIEKPQVVVKDLDSDSDEGHVVNLSKLTCTCDDFEYNCDSNQYCKHVFRVVFEKHGLV